jgi:hypothetical protein
MLRGNVDVAINVGYDVPVTDIARVFSWRAVA